MKRLLFSIVILISTAIVSTSFTTLSAPAKIYPELETFFKSLDVKKFHPSHLQSLENIKGNISTSTLDYDDWNMIFYCSENSFRSQASQVFLQTLCYVNKYKRVKAFFAGLSATEVNPKLIAFLSKVGYKVSKLTENDKIAYEVRFSDKEDPILLYSKTTKDKSLPSKDVTSIIVCDVEKEIECTSLKTESTPVNLPFQKVGAADPDDKVESILLGIATEMLYVTKK